MRHWLALGLVTALGSNALAQSAIMGVVREHGSYQRLENVEVLVAQVRATRSDTAGRFLLTVAPGTHVAVFRRLGFLPESLRVTTVAGDTAFVDAVMVPDPTQLAAIEIQREPVRQSLREQFYDRQKLGFGKFLDTAQMRRYEGRQAAEVLRELGVGIIRWDDPDCPPPFCDYELRAVDRNTLDMCAVSVVYDGVVIYRSGSPGRPPDFKKEFPVSTLSRVEFYKRTAAMPLEFMGYGTRCGLLLLWSRRG